MNRPEAARAVRMFIHYDRADDVRNDAEYYAREDRRDFYQRQLYELCPTEAEIIAGCGGVDGQAAESIRVMLDKYADYARKAGG